MTVQSIYDEVSGIYGQGNRVFRKSGGLFLCREIFGVVKEVDKDRETLSVTCSDIDTLFSRDIPDAPGTVSGSIEGYIKSLIDKYYVNQPDAVYATPYLTVAASTSTAGSALPDVRRVWNVKSYPIQGAAAVQHPHILFSSERQAGDAYPLPGQADAQGIPGFVGLRILEESFAHDAVGRSRP